MKTNFNVNKLVLLLIIFYQCGLKCFSQIVIVDFNNDLCESSTCLFSNDLISNGCIKSTDQFTTVHSLGGLNKVTDICENYTGVDWYSSINLGGTNRKYIPQGFSRICDSEFENCFEEWGQSYGIYLNIPGSALKDNFFYEVYYDMTQIWEEECQPPGLFLFPVIGCYIVDDDDPDHRYLNNNITHNTTIRNTYAQFLGDFTVAGQTQGTTVTSPRYSFECYNETVQDYFLQIGLSIEGSGNCSGLQEEPESVTAYASLLDDVKVDCDRNNIVFDFEVRVCGVDELTSCEGRKYCAEISTTCPNVNYNDFNYSIQVLNNSTVVKTVNGAGKITQFSMEDLSTGSYTFKIVYNTSNGKNVKVMQFQLNEATPPFYHVQNQFYYLNENTTFDNPIYIPSLLVINSPYTLTIKDDAFFNTNAQLIVRPGATLVVEGIGHLTACNSRWEGVLAEGNANIVVRENGSISFANKGIYNDGNGSASITLNRAHFNSNLIGVHLQKSAIPIIEYSYFTEGTTGVLLDNVTGGTAINGVYFKRNEFSFMSKEGILSYNTPIQVEDGNEFSYCYDGVALRDLFGSNLESFIGINEINYEEYNYFEYNQNAVYLNGSEINIVNNVFDNNTFGGFYSGFSSIETERNEHTGY